MRPRHTPYHAFEMGVLSIRPRHTPYHAATAAPGMIRVRVTNASHIKVRTPRGGFSGCPRWCVGGPSALHSCRGLGRTFIGHPEWLVGARGKKPASRWG